MRIKEKLTGRVETAAAKVIPKLPTTAVRKMAGDPLVIDGRTLDPHLQLVAGQAAGAPPLSTLTPDQARAAADESFAMTNGSRADGVAVSDRTIPGPVTSGAGLPVRIYQPDGADGLRPGVLFVHQGGWVIGGLGTGDTFCTRLAAELGAVVVSVDYRLAPGTRLPAQHDDVDAAWAWMRSNADGLGVDTDRMVVCGDSAGGQMSAALCQRLRDRGEPQPAVQVLVYPAVDMTAEDGSMVTCAETFPLDTATMDYFMAHALPAGFDRADPVVSPALHPELGGVAAAVVVTAGFDPLRDQGIAFALALRAAGVHVVDRCEDSMCHAFLSLGGVSPGAAEAAGRLIDDIAALV